MSYEENVRQWALASTPAPPIQGRYMGKAIEHYNINLLSIAAAQVIDNETGLQQDRPISSISTPSHSPLFPSAPPNTPNTPDNNPNTITTVETLNFISSPPNCKPRPRRLSSSSRDSPPAPLVAEGRADLKYRNMDDAYTVLEDTTVVNHRSEAMATSTPSLQLSADCDTDGDMDMSTGEQILTAARPERKIYGSVKPAGRDNKKKHKPIAPRGMVFLEADNAHLPREPAVLNVPDMTKVVIRMVANTGDIAIHRYQDTPRWDDPRWISEINKWRSQTFRRTFHKDPKFVKNAVRANWSVAEFEDLCLRLEKRVTKKGRRPGIADFQKLTEAHNVRWANSWLRAGSPLYKGDFAGKDVQIAARTAPGIQAMYLRDKEMQEFVDEAVKLNVSKAALVDSDGNDDDEDDDDGEDDEDDYYTLRME